MYKSLALFENAFNLEINWYNAFKYDQGFFHSEGWCVVKNVVFHTIDQGKKKKLKLRRLSQKQKNVSIHKSDYDISKEALHENGIFVILCACFCSRISTAIYRINSFYTRCVLKLSYSIQLIFNMNWQQN